MEKNNRLWVWGYVQDKIPQKVPFVPFDSYCSLETACNYLGADNAVYMNSMGEWPDQGFQDGRLEFLKDKKQVVCALQHGNYLESAKRLSKFSLRHPNITGGIIDDFLDELGNYYKGPALMTPEQLRDIRDALKADNPNLKLYVVRYTRQNPERLLPYLDYFDVLNLWVWTSTHNFWDSLYLETIANYQVLYRKPILQGMFLHHYGLGQGETPAMDQDLLLKQCVKIGNELRLDHIDGWCILQNGWFTFESHRKQVTALREYLTWYFGTHTIR